MRLLPITVHLAVLTETSLLVEVMARLRQAGNDTVFVISAFRFSQTSGPDLVGIDKAALAENHGGGFDVCHRVMR